MRALVTTAFALTTLGLVGCANQTSIWRSEDGRDRVLAMDAQQRVAISSVESKVSEIAEKTSDGGTKTSKVSMQLQSDRAASRR